MMSLYCFIAGNEPFEPFCRGIRYKNGDIIIKNESTVLNIYEETNHNQANVYTALPDIMCVEFGTHYRNVEQDMLSYIKRAMETHWKIELWRTWMDEEAEAVHRGRNINGLTLDDLRWIYDSRYFAQPKCLTVYRKSGGRCAG